MKKQSILIIGIIAFFIAISIGYAIFSENLDINGTASAQGTFDVEFTDASVSSQIGASGSMAEISNDKNSLSINVPRLEYPGAYVEISVIVTNKGSIPSVLKGIEEMGLTTDNSVKISYTGLQELKDKEISQNETQNFIIKVMWDANSNVQLENVGFTIKLNYEQVKAQ